MSPGQSNHNSSKGTDDQRPSPQGAGTTSRDGGASGQQMEPLVVTVESREMPYGAGISEQNVYDFSYHCSRILRDEREKDSTVEEEGSVPVKERQRQVQS
ncbi:hypothetical protein RRG08_029632 [Elysia crispata]|uniref:Uncharacterized protein n=1 Tax=Elysia crispata TaxID=231223 RepID=A0AAE0XPY6_9GAST|nr:hypothetical protein RRG08_029632 [Elysia crispata]